MDAYAKEHGFSVVLDNGNQQLPVVLYTNPAVDITKAVVEAYNVKSGIPAPARSAAAPGAGEAAPSRAPPLPSQPPLTSLERYSLKKGLAYLRGLLCVPPIPGLISAPRLFPSSFGILIPRCLTLPLRPPIIHLVPADVSVRFFSRACFRLMEVPRGSLSRGFSDGTRSESTGLLSNLNARQPRNS